MIQALADRCLRGDVRAVARLISLLEDGDRGALAALDHFKSRSGRALVLGITGPPGSGKSTLTDKLIGAFRSEGKTVGVLAIDPSSPFSGGAILGDRLRMQGHATDPGVFIRSLASRGKLGGLSAATAFGSRVLEAAGYDVVIIETVGVGQSEIDIVKVADLVVLISVPGLGDDIQVIKAGIMEIGDIFVVNKSDREGADRVVRELRAMLETQWMLARSATVASGPDTLAARNVELLHHKPGAGTEAVKDSGIIAEAVVPEQVGEHVLPPVLKTVAETGAGVKELVAAIQSAFDVSRTTGKLEARRLESVKSQIRDLVAWRLLDYFEAQEGESRLAALARDVHDRRTDLYSAAQALYAAIANGGIS